MFRCLLLPLTHHTRVLLLATRVLVRRTNHQLIFLLVDQIHDDHVTVVAAHLVHVGFEEGAHPLFVVAEDSNLGGVLHVGRLGPLQRDAAADLGERGKEGEYLDERVDRSGLLLDDLFGLDEVGDMSISINTASVESASVAVDAATRNQCERERLLSDGDRGNDAHEAEDHDRDQILEQQRFEVRKWANNGGIELEGEE